MVREICRDEAFLAQKAEPATKEDLGTAQDLLDTLLAHKDGCVGMAANMIGVNKRIIVFDNDGAHQVMLNPVIIRQSEPYEAEEGCLSLNGTRKTHHSSNACTVRDIVLASSPLTELLACYTLPTLSFRFIALFNSIIWL